MSRHYRQMTQEERAALLAHGEAVGAHWCGGTIFSEVFRVSYDVKPGGSVRDRFLRDLPAIFADDYAEVRLATDRHIVVRMRATRRG